MAATIKVVVLGFSNTGTDGYNFEIAVYDAASSNNFLGEIGIPLQLDVDVTTSMTMAQVFAAFKTKLAAYCAMHSFTLADSDIFWPVVNPAEFAALEAAVAPKSFTNNASHSFVTTAAAANGFQLSSTRDAVVSYAVQISTTATIAGGAGGYVVLEIAATNSTTAADWKEIGRVTNSQTLSLALTLQSVQVSGGSLMGLVPTGYYTRLRTVTSSGTVSFTYNSGQEVLV